MPPRPYYNLSMRCALLIAVWAGCYSPAAPTGAPCESTVECPGAQHCSAGHCVIHDVPEVDASVIEDAQSVTVDAPSDAAPLACSTAGLTCSGQGVATMFTCGGNCWVRCTQHVTREAARAACAAWSGTLAVIDDATEETCATSHAPADTWIGLQQPPAQTMPGMGWTWNGATPPVYTRWATGRPDDQDDRENGQEQCGKIESSGIWDDVACNDQIAFFCERPQ